jgi:hypothetical protein
MRMPFALAYVIHRALGIVGLGLHARDTYIGEGLSETRYGICRRVRWVENDPWH